MENINKKATAQVSFWYGPREGEFRVQKAPAATEPVAFSLRSLLSPGVREKSWTSHGNICEAWS